MVEKNWSIREVELYIQHKMKSHYKIMHKTRRNATASNESSNNLSSQHNIEEDSEDPNMMSL